MDTPVKTGLRTGSMVKQSSFLALILNCVAAGFGAGILVALLLVCITLLVSAGQ